jgi:hypothetical protein
VTTRLESPVAVRAVRGRVIDPYRGAAYEEPQPEDFAPRRPEPQPYADVVARLRAIANTKVKSTGRRFLVSRGDEMLRISFVTAARDVSLDDVVVQGDPELAIVVFHALLSQLGAVEVRAGKHIELLDGHEPLDTVIERFRSNWIDEQLEVARHLPPPRSASAAPAPAPAVPLPLVVRNAVPPQTAVFGSLLILVIAMLVALAR